MQILKPLGLLTLLLGLVIGSSLSTMAGFDPTPFMPEINKLNAMDNHLNAIQNNINRVLGMPPDDQKPGTVKRLSAIDRQLYLIDASMESVVEEVLGMPPDDQHGMDDLVPAVTSVKETAQGIVNSINEYLGIPPDDIMPEDVFNYALAQVSITAGMVVDNATNYIIELENGGGNACSDFSSANECAPPCIWDPEEEICSDDPTLDN